MQEPMDGRSRRGLLECFVERRKRFMRHATSTDDQTSMWTGHARGTLNEMK